MDKYTYFWCLIIVAMTFFFIGAYKNIFLKIYYILWVNRKESDPKPASIKAFVTRWLPDNRTIINEAVIHERIKSRSNFLWVRHLLIFFGFMIIFFLDGFYTVAGHYFHHYFHYEFFMSGMGKAALKIRHGIKRVVPFCRTHPCNRAPVSLCGNRTKIYRHANADPFVGRCCHRISYGNISFCRGTA